MYIAFFSLHLLCNNVDSFPVERKCAIAVFLLQELLDAPSDFVRLEQTLHDGEPTLDGFFGTVKVHRDRDVLVSNVGEADRFEHRFGRVGARDGGLHRRGDDKVGIGTLDVRQKAGRVPDGNAKDSASLQDAEVLCRMVARSGNGASPSRSRTSIPKIPFCGSG